MKKLLSFLFGKKKQVIKTPNAATELENLENLVITFSAMRANGQYQEAIQLYEKHTDRITGSDIELPAITSIMRISEEAADTEKLLKYAKRLRVIERNHPYVKQLEAKYSF